jgi:DNA polymerase I-like protein with 3'-5' exonuclease and polymerase domains
VGMPNVREMFVPDLLKMMFDLDLDSADLRIVTWESNCRGMKALFAEKKKPYLEVAREYYHDNSIDKTHPAYQVFKKLCHGTNYLGKPPTIAAQCGLLVNDVTRIQKWYFGMFPEIEQWQKRLIAQCTRTATVSNAFGYRRKWFDRIEGNVLNEMVAWIPQSTVGLIINHAYVAIDAKLPDVEILLQVHDSLTGQFPIENAAQHLLDIEREAQIIVPYPEPLIVPVGIKTSTDSWGKCK